MSDHKTYDWAKIFILFGVYVAFPVAFWTGVYFAVTKSLL